MQNIVYILLFLFMIGFDISMHAKGYMALKNDLGYEAEHQRPENSLGYSTGRSDNRNFIQNYGLTTNPNPTYNSIQNAQSYTSISGDFYGLDEIDNDFDFTDFEMDLPNTRDPRDIAIQTRYVVDHPYDHEFE